MIEALGLSPINSVVNAGISDFISLFRNGVSTAYANGTGNRKYTTVRGSLVPEKVWEKTVNLLTDKNEMVIFQFNPDNIQDSKNTYWSDREYTGLGFTDSIWSRGGSRQISFNLFLDDTLGSGTDEFGLGDVNGLVTKPSSTTSARQPQVLREIESYKKSFKSAFSSLEEPKALEWKNPNGLKTRRHQRGVLDEVEKIQSFLYPERIFENGKYTEEIPKFVEGGMVTSHQFRPPATLVFSYGDSIVLKGVLLSAPVEYTLFDEDLTPIRATVTVEFRVIETSNLKLTR